MRTLLDRWKAKAAEQAQWRDEARARNDGANAHAHQKAHRIICECIAELEAEVQEIPTSKRIDNEIIDFLVALHGYPDRATAFRNCCEQMFDEVNLIESWRSLRPHPDHPAAAVQEIPIARPPDPVDERVLLDLETRIFYAETSVRSLVDSARLYRDKFKAAIPSSPSAPDLLISRVRTVVGSFEASEAAGYRSRERRYAIEMLRPALDALEHGAASSSSAEPKP